MWFACHDSAKLRKEDKDALSKPRHSVKRCMNMLICVCFFRIFAESQQGNMVRKSRQKIVGMSYAFRVQDIVRIYDEHARSGLSNREILRRYIWPKYRICEKTFYNIINASADPRVTERIAQAERQLTLFG